MTYVEKVIKRLYPDKIICYRLSDLTHQSSNDNLKQNDICIGIETDNHTRRFCYLTMSELICLFQHCPTHERCLYELIPPESVVKAYIDFEYYVNYNPDLEESRIGPKCVLKMIHLLFNLHEQINYESQDYMNCIFKQFLVLDA